ncbi:MAG: site-specific integrase [Lachnospiraceae bacterium]|nr:site-specific integrase [Lachnospiraceae bacterium]
MLICKSGRTIIKNKNGVDTIYIRLNLIDNTASGKDKYHTKDIDTGFKDSRRNRIKANSMVESEINRFAPVGRETPFHEYCLKWLEEKKKRDKISIITYEGYQYRLSHIVDYFSEHPVMLGDVTIDHIDAFYTYLLKKPKDKKRPAQRDEVGLSNRTMKDIAVLVRSILSDALQNGHVSDEKAFRDAIRLKVPKKDEALEDSMKDDLYLDEETIPAFLEAIRGHRLEAAFYISLFFGLRREELVGLQWSAIRHGELHIFHTVSRVKTTVSKNSTKTPASQRSYPIPQTIMEMLNGIQEKQECNRKLMGDSYYQSDYIFTWEDGRPYSPDYITKSFKKLVRDNENLDSNLHFHNLRTSCVSLLIHQNEDVKSTQKWVGHKDAQTTLQYYAKMNKRDKERVMEKMEAVLTLKNE